MRALLLPLLAILAALSLGVAMAAGSSSWPVTGHDAGATGFNPDDHAISAANVVRLRPIWTRRYTYVIDTISDGNRVFSIVRTGQRSSVVVLDARSGNLLRSFSPAALHLTTPPFDDPQALAYTNGRLVIAATRDIVEVSPTSGGIFWKQPSGADGMTIAGRTIYTGKGCQNPCGTLASYAIDLYRGRIRWVHKGNFGHPPVLLAGRLYQTWGEASESQTRVYDPASGALLATMPLNANWLGDSHHSYANVLVGGQPSTTYRVWIGDVGGNGKPIWKTDLGKPDRLSAVLAYNTMFVTSYRFHPGVIAVNAKNGKLVWAVDAGHFLSLIAANHLVYILQSSTGKVMILNAGNGKLLHILAISNHQLTGGTPDLIVAGGTLYVVDGQAITAYRT